MQLRDRVGRRIKLHDLNVLMTVVQAGSMNKAAVILHTTQPAISRSITELERTVGVRLLDRHPRGVEPTAFGRALLDGGTAMFDELSLAVRRIEYLADPTAGDVRIACNPSVATSFLPAVFDRISKRYPNVCSHVTVQQHETLHRTLSERNVDLLVARRFGNLDDGQLSFEFLFSESYVVAVGAQNPLGRRRNLALSDVANEPWTLPPPENALGSIARTAFRASGLEYPPASVITAAPDMRISLLANGRFLSIFPDTVLRFPTGRPELKVLPIKVPVRPVPIGIVTLRNRTLSPVAKLFIEQAREIAAPIAKQK